MIAYLKGLGSPRKLGKEAKEGFGGRLLPGKEAKEAREARERQPGSSRLT